MPATLFVAARADTASSGQCPGPDYELKVVRPAPQAAFPTKHFNRTEESFDGLGP